MPHFSINLKYFLIRIDKLHSALHEFAFGARLQIVGTPLTVLYEEGGALSSDFMTTANYLSKTILTIGQLSVQEILPGQAQSLVKLLEFKANAAAAGQSNSPDLKVIVKETAAAEEGDKSGTVTNVEVVLNPCQVDLDPGLVDRTYLLANFKAGFIFVRFFRGFYRPDVPLLGNLLFTHSSANATDDHKF